MSGPRDRPSSDDPDAQWPSEDLGQASDRGQARDPANEGAPGWDDWPPAPPPSYDGLIDEPLPPSSDPWAESWTEEEADAMLRSASAETEPVADRWEPSPAPEPEPEPAPVDDRIETDVEPVPDHRPHVEPWSPDPDPWRFEPEPVAASPEPEPPTEPATEPADRAEPIPAEPPPVPAARWPAPAEELPDWLAEPLPADTPQAQLETEAPPEPEGAPEAEPEPVTAAPASDDVAGVSQAEAELEPQPADDSGSFWNSIFPWRSTTGPDAESAPSDQESAGGSGAPAADEPEPAPQADAGAPDAPETADAPEVEHPWIEVDETDPEPAMAAEAQAEAEPESGGEPEVEPRWPASVPEREWSLDASDDASDDDAPSEERAADAPAFVPIGGGLTYAAATEGEPEPEIEPAPEPVAATAAPWAAPEPESQPDPWADADWSDGGDSTQVLPSDWTVARPEPPIGALEPSAGPVRTRLAEPDADLDEEAAPTIAEQAVPWLIGVILLLAGMVIVLLALIFAGDGSLGGGLPSSSPGPTLAVVPPGARASATPSPTPAPTRTAEPSGTPEPTPTSEPPPEYGPLEMVYQGRSAALAPIYLLRRDFTVADDPAVLAQDASLDVRRFAWAPDGRVGAGLLADVLVSIEPGTEKRRLGDGLMTITFGDDTSTVYAVRITEEGTTDTATVLGIDFISGDTEELASVSYERPQLGSEAALAEARFSDEGGAVRLYWLANDVLRLWVLGVGAWTVDPGGGDPTELDGEPLPTLLAPNGREQITAEAADGATTLTRLDLNDRPLASTTVEGMVSHVRWSPAGDRVVFTLGRSAAGGGVLQDLFLWDLGDGQAPMQLTSTGAAFGAEWLGTQPRWRE